MKLTVLTQKTANRNGDGNSNSTNTDSTSQNNLSTDSRAGFYKVKTAVFEGPLEILLELIEKRKLFIGDIQLSKVTDDFINYIRQFSDIPIGVSANFILVASTLLLIKSKALLPSLALSEEEQNDVTDLNTRLKLLAKIKEGSSIISQNYLGNPLFETNRSRTALVIFAPDKMTNLNSLHGSIISLLAAAPKAEKTPTAVLKKVISLEEMIDNLSKRISSNLKMTFKEFARSHSTENNAHSRVHVIVGFLAMLELVKNGLIHVNQESNFSDIHIESKDVGIPRYN